jgi:transposase
LSYKKLEKGCFHWPKSGGAEGRIVLSHEEFAMLVGGIDMAQTERRRWYRMPVVEESGN